MRVTAIQVENFLSYEEFTWENIDERLNIIVGPNGVGKTNLFHAFHAVTDALGENRHRWFQFADPARTGQTFFIEIAISFESAWERAFITSFVRAALAEHTTRPNFISVLPVELLQRLQPDDIAWFFTGWLSIQCHPDGTWLVAYASVPSTEYHERNRVSQRLDFYLSLATPPTGFEHSKLSWDFPRTVAVANAQTAAEEESNESRLSEIRKKAEEDARSVSSRKPTSILLRDYLSGEEPDLSTAEVAALTHTLLRRGPLSVEYKTQLATHQAFERLSGVSLLSGKRFEAPQLFAHLLRHAFVFIDNVRQPAEEQFTHRERERQPYDLSSGRMLAPYLHALKNGGYSERQRYAAIQETFTLLTEEKFDLTERIIPATGRKQDEDTTELRVVILGEGRDYPLRFGGAGRAEALFLSAVIHGDDGRVVLLDEPAQNLHPNVQATLLHEILDHNIANASNQFFVVTHSPGLSPRIAWGASPASTCIVARRDGLRWTRYRRRSRTN